MLLFDTEAKRHAVTATWDADPLLTVRGDRNQIQQILLNLLFNAREAVGSDGWVRITATADKGEGWITVSNSGPPLPAAHLPLIFLPFFTTKQDQPHGHGMGLAVCLSLARRMGGTITVKSEPGGETAFSLVLPSADAP
jgi:signal transduction histidine kinase